ncbi:MAG: DHA2 family efflux MFS transporter permease subunit [Aquificae bacterium]|nr:DHA2 family efflux MFS transporter permease subunit [Aquificota bacterium]
MVGAFMAILDTTIVDVVLPKMMAPLKTDLYGIQWVVTAYMMAAATSLPLLENLSLRFGLKPVYLAGVLLFTVSSYLCGTAEELSLMILYRTVQGFAEALIMVSAQAILFTLYPPEKRGVAMGVFGLGASFAPAVGPTLGGWLTEHLSWHWVFFINVPVGVFLFTASLFFLPEPLKERKKLPFNFVSFLFLSVATVSTLLVLSKGQQYGWFTSNFIAFTALIAVVSYVLFFVSELLSRHPLVEPSLLKRGNVLVALWVFTFVLGFSMYAVFYAVPLYFEHLKGLSTLQTGLLILPFAFAIAVFSVLAGVLSDRWSAEGTLFTAIAVYFVSLYLLSDTEYYTPKEVVSAELTVMGVGLGLFFAPVTVLALKNLEEKSVAVISLLDYVRFVGGSFGTAVATNTLKGKTAEHFEGIGALQGLEYHFVFETVKAKAEHFLNASASYEEALLKAFYAVGQLQFKVAYGLAFGDLFVVSGAFALVGVLALAAYQLKSLIKLKRR